MDKNCWICHDQAGSTEHLIKKSDLRARFGAVSPDEPLYLHTPERKNIAVRGLKSKLLLSGAPICARCNNERSQPYDRAWQRLSEYLGGGQAIRVGRSIRLLNVFPGSVRSSKLDLHLYFVKAFGCKVVESGAGGGLDVRSLGDALLNRRAHPDVFVAICPPFKDYIKRHVSSHIQALDSEQSGRTFYAGWYYSLDHVSVRVVYAIPGFRDRNGMLGAWHPSNPSSRLRIAPHMDVG